MTQQDLADIVGARNYTTITKWESGDNVPQGKDLIILSQHFNVSVDSILGIDGKLKVEKTNEYRYLPASISAGIPLSVECITEAEKIDIPDSIMGKWAGDKNIMMMRINGDSMDKTMPHNSLIAVKPVELSELKDEDIVVFSNEYEYSVKRYYNDTENKRIIFRPHSNNRKFIDTIINYEESSNLLIHGKVVLYIVELD